MSHATLPEEVEAMALTRVLTAGGKRSEEVPAARLALLLKESGATVGVVGLGQIGLPLALALGENGLPVLGFDVDDAKIEALNAGRPCLRHIEEGRVRALI